MKNFIQQVLEELGYSVNLIPHKGHEAICLWVNSEKANRQINILLEVSFVASIDDEVRNKFKTLMFNSIWPLQDHNYSTQEIYEFIKESFPSESPVEKLNRVLLRIYSLSSYDGERIDIKNEDIESDSFWRKAFLKNSNEFLFYLKTLIDIGYIQCQNQQKSGFYGVGLTVSGLEKVIQIEEIIKTKTCFVAMSFAKELEVIYEKAIAPAIEESGYKSYIVREEKEASSDVTINDKILAGIKRAKFTIADFTGQRNGVYFEAGYALGLGQNVIYCCREDDMKNAHFDTRNYFHIVWKDAEDFKQKLIDKIEVFIKD
jgi:nucleoside 2-deoxyribosyltransferase